MNELAVKNRREEVVTSPVKPSGDGKAGELSKRVLLTELYSSANAPATEKVGDGSNVQGGRERRWWSLIRPT